MSPPAWNDLLRDPPAALTETVAAACQTLGMDGAGLLLLDGRTAALAAACGTPPARAACSLGCIGAQFAISQLIR